MKKLYIVRHGKSSWKYEDIADIDRPLSERGISNAHSQSGYFIANNNTPDLIISSPANRALHTAVIFARNMMMDFNRLKIDPGIYMGDTSEILSIIKSTIDDVNSLMIFGHNPSFTELANHFLNYPVENIPTAGMVFLTFTNVSWAEISPKYVETEDMKFPKK